MALTKVQAEGVNLADSFSFTGTLDGHTNPAFQAKLGSDASLSNDTVTKIAIDTEDFDTDGKFASNRFTPTVAGKYYCHGGVGTYPGTGNLTRLIIYIYKNGAEAKRSEIFFNTGGTAGTAFAGYVGGIIDLDTDDYIELYARLRTANGSSVTVGAGGYTQLGAFRIGT
tara:strand:+ start:26 stop:532 length:507 start_codon:yes stop_codon:yes gene_type:complete